MCEMFMQKKCFDLCLSKLIRETVFSLILFKEILFPLLRKYRPTIVAVYSRANSKIYSFSPSLPPLFRPSSKCLKKMRGIFTTCSSFSSSLQPPSNQKHTCANRPYVVILYHTVHTIIKQKPNAH